MPNRRAQRQPYALDIPPAHVLEAFAYPTPAPDPFTGILRRKMRNAPATQVSMLRVVPVGGIGAVFLQESEEGKLVRVVVAHIDDVCGRSGIDLAARQLASLFKKKGRGVTARFVASSNQVGGVIACTSGFRQEHVDFDKLVFDPKQNELRVSLVTGRVIPRKAYESHAMINFKNGDEIRQHIEEAEERKTLRSDFVAYMGLGAGVVRDESYRPTQADYGFSPLRRLTLADVALP